MYRCITWHRSGLRFWVSCVDLFNPLIRILCVHRDTNTQRAVGTFWLLHVHQRTLCTAHQPNIRNFHRVTYFYVRLTWTNKILSQIFIHTVNPRQALQVKGKKALPYEVTKTQKRGWNVGLLSLLWQSAKLRRQSCQLYALAALYPKGNSFVILYSPMPSNWTKILLLTTLEVMYYEVCK